MLLSLIIDVDVEIARKLHLFDDANQFPARNSKKQGKVAIACFVLVRLRSPEGHTWKLDGVSIENNKL